MENKVIKIICIRDSYMYSSNGLTNKIRCGMVYFTPFLDIGASYLNWISVYNQYNGGYQFIGTFMGSGARDVVCVELGQFGELIDALVGVYVNMVKQIKNK